MENKDNKLNAEELNDEALLNAEELNDEALEDVSGGDEFVLPVRMRCTSCGAVLYGEPPIVINGRYYCADCRWKL